MKEPIKMSELDTGIATELLVCFYVGTSGSSQVRASLDSGVRP